MLEELRQFRENSRLAKEFALSGGRRYQLGCDRYRRERPPTSSYALLRRIVADDPDTSYAGDKPTP